MLYHICFSLFFSVAIAVSAIAQDVFVSEGRSLRGDDEYTIVGKIGENVLLFVEKADTYEVQAFDSEMKKLWEKKVEFDSKRAKVLNVNENKNHFTVIYKYNKRGKTFTQAVKFDANAEVLTTDTVEVKPHRSFYSLAGNVMSQDRRYILMYEMEMSERIYATVYDMQEMRLVWHKVLQIKDIDIDRDFVQVIVDDSARGYFIFSKDNRRMKREDSRFLIVNYDNETGVAKDVNISMQGRIWFDVGFEYDNLNDRLIAGGLYLDKRYTESNGYFFIRANMSSLDTQKVHFEPFEEKFIARAIGKEATKNRGIGEVSVRQLVMRQDGGALMIVERSRFYARNAGASLGSLYPSNEDRSLRMDYHLEDILLFAIHPDGKLHWSDVLQKRQFSQDDGARFSSFLLMHTPRNLRFLYNNEIRHKTNINEYIVNGTGNLERNSIYNSETHDVLLALREAKQISANEAIIASERRNTLKLVRMVYP